MLTFNNEDAAGIVRKNLGEEAVKETASLRGISNRSRIGGCSKSDVQLLKASKLIPEKVNISGGFMRLRRGR